MVNCEIVSSDRQFYGAVHVISWTVALILSSMKISDMGLYHSKTLLAKQGTLLYECWPDLAVKYDIFTLSLYASPPRNSAHTLACTHQLHTQCDICLNERYNRVFPILVLKLVELDKCFIDSVAQYLWIIFLHT